MYKRCIKSLLANPALYLCLFAVALSVANNANADNVKKQKLLLIAEKRILNGKPTTIEFFPHMVQLVTTHFRMHLCGGFLVTDHHVVTAAHCVRKSNSSDLQIIANSTERGHGQVTRRVDKIYIPKNYDIKTRRFDVAVLRLDKPLQTGKGIQIAKLCDNPWQREETVTIAGWGNTKVNGGISATLMTARTTTIGDGNCKKRLNHILVDGRRKYKFTKTMSCAKARHRVDACQGDSGGPAYINGTVCGIVSYGISCGRNEYPSFYTSVAKVRNFIRNSIKDKI